jgi:predicted phage terminase large subunit-like protein
VIETKECIKCKSIKPVTLFTGSKCQECIATEFEEDLLQRQRTKDRLSEDQIARAIQKAQREQRNEEKELTKLALKSETLKTDSEKNFAKSELTKQALTKQALTKQELARQELAKRELSRRKLIPFVKRFNEDYLPGWVHIDIADRLEKFSDAVTRKESPRLMLFLPPRHGKSELASKTFPAWHLGRYPKHEVIASSYAADLAMDFSRKVRGVISDPDYRKIFPDTKLDKKSQAAERWNTDVGGGYVAAGVGGAITGRGAHIGIIDDPIKNREDAESASNRQKIKDWYTSTFYTRLAPGGGVLIILTRWHDDDLAGWLIEEEKRGGDEWEIVRYPAVAIADEKYRKQGEALHDDRYPIEALDRIKRAVGNRDWSALYQQNPVPDEGAYFQKPWFKYYEIEPDRDTLTIYQAWDFAIGQSEHNDYTVGVTIGVAKNDKVYVLNVCRGKWDALDIVEHIIDQYVAYKPQIVGVERGQIEMALGPMLNKRMAERRVFFATEQLKTGRRDKQARARPLQARLQQGMVLFNKHDDATIEIRDEMLRFPAGVHDDQVDALAWCFQMIDKFTVVRDPKPQKTKSWKDRLSQYTKSRSRGSHMRA